MNALQGFFYLNRNTTARKNFPLEILLFHPWASACNKSTDSPWRTDSKNRSKLAQGCAAPEGSCKLLPHRRVCEPGPPESHYGSTFLFAALINKNSRSHPVLLCQNLHDVWGPSAHASARGQIKCVLGTEKGTPSSQNYRNAQHRASLRTRSPKPAYMHAWRRDYFMLPQRQCM